MNIKLLRCIDKYLFGFLVILFLPLKYLYFFKKNKVISAPQKVLVIRLWALWSSLLTFSMITELRNHYGSIQYDLLCTSRNQNVFKNQWYFHNFYNLFSLKGILTLFFLFKKYDIVIDAEDYFRVSTLSSLWLWKVTVWYGNIFSRSLWYTFPITYNDRQHALITFMDLLCPFWISYGVPQRMETFKILDQGDDVVADVLSPFQQKLKLCFHTWWAETSPERFWHLDNWVSLIDMISENQKDIVIFLSWTKFEIASVDYILTHISENSKKVVISVCWKFNLSQFAYFLTKVNFLVSNDTWAMHLWASVWTKTIGLFWPNLPDRFWPYPLNVNKTLYKGDWKAFIDVHLWEFRKCTEDIINRILPREVYDELFSNHL